VLLANVPLAPVAGAVKVTETPLAGDPLEVTVATSGLANAVPTARLRSLYIRSRPAMAMVGGDWLAGIVIIRYERT
jgi:hypothetical protein